MPLKSTKKQNLNFGVLCLFMLLFMNSFDMFSQGPPPWAPAHGYRSKTKYIYFPDQNIYYDIPTHNYIYFNAGVWSTSVSIPRPFINVNFSVMPKIELDFVGPRPYIYNEQHKIKYKKKKDYKKHKHHHHNHHHKGKHGKH